jgi:uroporphyrinogen-III synthase
MIVSSPVVCSFESRRADDMAALIKRYSGVAVLAPSMREVPIEDNPAAIDCIQRIIAGQFDIVVLLTGVGTRALFDVARSQNEYDELIVSLKTVKLVIRGPKPAVVLQKAGLRHNLKASAPNTWRELVAVLDDSGMTLERAQIAVQEYGLPNERFYEQLRKRGAVVTPVPVYKWALPQDAAPLRSAIQQTIDGPMDILLFTSANQLSNVLTMAERMTCCEAFRRHAATRVVASIGPTCTEALRDNGFPVHFEASPTKIAPLVRGAIETWQQR